jgi:hypothetical protein
MDPGGAQGANNAVHCAFQYLHRILERADGPFDRDWMEKTTRPWLTGVAYPAARWTATVLDPPPPVQAMMLAAQNDAALANAFANTFARPTDLIAPSQEGARLPVKTGADGGGSPRSPSFT